MASIEQLHEPLQSNQNAIDYLDEVLERFNNRLVLHGESLVEQYLVGRLCFVLEFRAGREPMDDVPPNTSHSKHFIDVPSFVLYVHSKSCHVEERKQDHVLIFDVQCVKGPNGVALPSVVRFHTKYKILKSRNGSYFNTSDGGYYSFTAIPDRELSVVVNCRRRDLTEKLTPSQIQSGAKIMDGISDNGSQIESQRLLRLVIENQIPGLAINILDEGLEVRLNKVSDPDFDLRDVLLGPFNL